MQEERATMTHQLTRRRSLITLAIAAIGVTLSVVMFTSAASGNGNSDRGRRYEVTITNVTKGQVISPVVMATHSSGMQPIYSFGSPASDELAGVAEDAVLQPLIDMLNADPSVANVVTIMGAGGPIMPGETASAIISTHGNARELSMAAMLVTTNDTFTGLNGYALPGNGYVTYIAGGYDAGSEVNNEDCDYIPGPPCDNAGVRATEGAEGFVYVSNGIHGIADLDPVQHDWNNPVAIIKVRRISGNN